MEVLSCKSPTLKHISEISQRPMAFPAKLPIRGIPCWTGMGWHYFQKFLSQNFTLGRKEPTVLIHWLEMVQGKHGISIHRAAAGGCQSVPGSRFTRRKSECLFPGHHILNLQSTDTFVHSCSRNSYPVVPLTLSL